MKEGNELLDGASDSEIDGVPLLKAVGDVVGETVGTTVGVIVGVPSSTGDRVGEGKGDIVGEPTGGSEVSGPLIDSKFRRRLGLPVPTSRRTPRSASASMASKTSAGVILGFPSRYKAAAPATSVD